MLVSLWVGLVCEWEGPVLGVSLSLGGRQNAQGVVTVISGLLQLVHFLETARQPHQGEEPMGGGRGWGLSLVVIVTRPAQFVLQSLGVEQRTQGLLVTSHPQRHNTNSNYQQWSDKSRKLRRLFIKNTHRWKRTEDRRATSRRLDY